MYESKTLNHKVIECMTTVVNKLLKSVTTEICVEKNKNVITSCVYTGHQGPVLNLSGTGWRKCFQKRGRRVLFICGDFNIDR